jgi:DNA (cytosine-5)-methyltransferase 1
LLWRILRSLPEGADVDSAETTHLSFCAGYGGIDLGLQRVLPSCRTVAYVEIEAFAIANLVAKMEAGDLDAAPVWTDIKTFPAEPFRGLVDIISGGYPCQPFSAAGSRLGTKDPRHLWPFLRRAIRVIQPGRVFLENVEGHISLGLSTVISDLEEDGYRATWGIFSAAEVGASHQRKRVFIYGELADTSSARAATWLSESQQRKEGHAEKPDNGGNRRFPARPGQPQFHWEEPRTVAATKSKQSVINAQTGHRRQRVVAGGKELGNTGGTEPNRLPDKERTGLSRVGESDSRKAEPKLGGATDGCTSTVDATANRVDRLRLLGNGVVPATAAKAWTVLSKRFEHYES